MKTPMFLVLLMLVCAGAKAETYPIASMTAYEPATIHARVSLQNGTLLIENTGASAWQGITLYAQCLDEPENFSTRLPYIPAHGTARLPLGQFRRGAGDGHRAERLGGGPHAEIDDLLIVCRSGSRKGRWYGIAQGVRSTHITVIPL